MGSISSGSDDGITEGRPAHRTTQRTLRHTLCSAGEASSVVLGESERERFVMRYPHSLPLRKSRLEPLKLTAEQTAFFY